MKMLSILWVVTGCFLLISNLADAGDYTLWGKQTEGWGATNAKSESDTLTLTKAATITKVERGSKGFCIWSGGKSVLCGGGERPSIIGKTLEPGTYTVLPTAGTEVIIYLSDS